MPGWQIWTRAAIPAKQHVAYVIIVEALFRDRTTVIASRHCTSKGQQVFHQVCRVVGYEVNFQGSACRFSGSSSLDLARSESCSQIH
jgi:hypothetical protein